MGHFCSPVSGSESATLVQICTYQYGVYLQYRYQPVDGTVVSWSLNPIILPFLHDIYVWKKAKQVLYLSTCLWVNQRYTEINHDPLLLSVAQGIFWQSTERLSLSTLHLKEGGRWESLFMYSVLHPRLSADSDKIPEGGTSTYILHLSGVYKCVVCQGRGQDGHQHGEEDCWAGDGAAPPTAEHRHTRCLPIGTRRGIRRTPANIFKDYSWENAKQRVEARRIE